MTILTQGALSAAFLLSEANDWRSRQQVTVTLPEGGLESGTILGQITSGGKYVRHDSDLSNGAETEAGILLINQTETGDVEATIIARDAEVNGAELTYEDGADDAAKAASNVALAALGIIVR